MSGKKGQKKRFWSDEEKQTICDQARADGISVAQVARRYSMNTNLIHKWLRDPRFVTTDVISDIGMSSFLPIQIKGCRLLYVGQICQSQCSVLLLMWDCVHIALTSPYRRFCRKV